MKFLIVLTILLLANCIKVRHEGINNEVKSYKLWFMYRYQNVRNNPTHKLNLFTYKNILLGNDEVVVYESTNELESGPDLKYDTTKYLITFRYEYMDLPCIGGTFLCSYADFTNEYKTIYPEINYEIPNEMREMLGDKKSIVNNCLLIPVTPVMDVKDAAWVCHPDMNVIVEFQFQLSKIIFDANRLNYEFSAEYVTKDGNVKDGIVTISNKEFMFNTLQKELIYKYEWKEFASYSNSIYLKDVWEWKGKEGPQDSTRCLKIVREKEKDNKNPDYFCIFFHRHDTGMKIKLKLTEARYSVNMYANKLNLRFHWIMVKWALSVISKETEINGKLNIDSKALFYVKMDVRMKYLKHRHIIITKYKLGLMDKTEIKLKLEEIKEKIIDRSCEGSETCKKAIKFCLDNKLLTLNGEREKLTWDWQNPFILDIPKENIKIDVKKGTQGEKIMEQVTKLAGTNNYMTESIQEGQNGNPNHISLKKALNTLYEMRTRDEYKSAVEFKQLCDVNLKNNSNNIKRKISMLSLAGENDCFFDYLGYIRDEQLAPVK